jgi:hypothetical protein
MDLRVRICKQQLPNHGYWSLKAENGVLTVQGSEAWAQEFTVVVQNHLGHSQTVIVKASPEPTVSIPFSPYIQVRPSPARSAWPIPPYIFQTWKEGAVTDEMAAAQKTFRDQSGYSYVCWNDTQCFTFLKQVMGDRYANAYLLLTPGAYRADFWRYCALWRFGGVYADAKMRLLRPLDELIRSTDELVLTKDIPDTCILNGFFACTPQHPMIRLALDITLERIESRSYGEDPLDICGPHVFARAFCRWKGVADDSLTLSQGYTDTVQMLGRADDKDYISSPEGEKLVLKEYPTYYKKDIDVRFHYPQLWALRLVYKDQLPAGVSM